MPKALELSDDTMTAPPIPKAAQSTAHAPQKRTTKKTVPSEPKEPLQVRWPKSEVKAAKRAALDGDFSTVSDFMLACFHAYMQKK
jgi:hypothetical protein